VDPVVLTDDEAVALAVRRQAPWPGGLPTIEATEATVADAAFRGDRSLFVRGLQDDAALVDVVDALLAASRRLIVYLGDEEFRRASWGYASAHYVATGDWVFETVTPVGIHKLLRQPSEDHQAYVRALLDGAMSAGPPVDETQDDRPSWLCAIAESNEGGALVAARRDEVVCGPVATNSGPLAAGDLGAASVDEALSQVFDVLDG
jgi:hypothetical protein